MHIGLIMDGNGRWAKQRSLPRAAGHLEGLKAGKRIVKAASDLGIGYLSMYVFSTENWKRPQQEINYLMSLLSGKLPGEMPFYIENNVRIRFKGNLEDLPDKARSGVYSVLEQTKSCTGLNVILCVNYGGQDEIARAVNRFTKENPGLPVTVQDIEKNLDCPDVPPADIIVRSAGEKRLSNFLLWDSAYAEFLSIDKLWPDWDKSDLEFCITELSKRKRKFGGLLV